MSLSHSTIWIVIAGMALTNFILRWLPMAALSRIVLPRAVMRWLSYVPISVMGALFAKEVLLPSTKYHPFLASPGIYGALIAMLVYRLSRSFMGATLSGTVSFVLIRAGFAALGWGL